MGKIDATLERYLDDPARYADLLNGYRFRGQQIVKPEDVIEMDSRLSGRSRKKKRISTHASKRANEEHQKQRDIVRKVVLGTGVAVIALENQDLIHYAMPIRVMVEDSLEYDKQLRAIQREHRRKKDLTTPTEYIGQFSSNDQIVPTVTIVLYFGKEAWNGPRDLLDLMPIEELPVEIRQMINGYPLHILEVHNFEDFEYFQTDLREVFGIIQNYTTADKLEAYVKENSHRLKNLAEDAYEVIAAVTNDNAMDEMKDECRKEDGSMNVYAGFTGWAEKLRITSQMEGRAEGHAEGLADASHRIARNAFNMGFDIEKVATLCGESPELIKNWFDEWRLTENTITTQ